jgi:hypothetical protein
VAVRCRPFADNIAFVIIFTYSKSWEEDSSILLDFLPNSIIPWLLGGLLLLALFTLSVTFKSWREVKRSPYYFLRIQAGKRMQRYLVASFVLILLAAATSAYAWQSPDETTPQVGVLKHAKPSLDAGGIAQEQEGQIQESPETITINLTPASIREIGSAAADVVVDPLQQPQTAPETSEQVVAASDPTGDASLGDILFSLDIGGDYRAIDPVSRFVEGFFTVYATFSYQGMADGMNWSWVWQRNGAEIEGGNQVWNYGHAGPGYIYFQPDGGFKAGEYSLAISVNGEQHNQAGFTVTEGIAATN